MVLILYEVFNKKMRGVYSYFTQLENMNNKICFREKNMNSIHIHIKLNNALYI